MIATLSFDHKIKQILPKQLFFSSNFQLFNYQEAERIFIKLLQTENLDEHVKPELVEPLEAVIITALNRAYGNDASHLADTEVESAHLFLQRILYHINRLNLFWYDDLKHYQNERSYYLQLIRDRIEKPWQAWELQQFEPDYISHLQALDINAIKEALIERGQKDLNPPITPNKTYLRNQMTVTGYKQLLAIASLDGLVEASRMSRILGGASNEIQATLIRVLLEEYGNGRLSRKHSTFFAQMMAELELNTTPENYFELAPWQLLASINHNFLLTECKRHFLRYNGGLTYFEIVGPSIYTDYRLASERLGLSEKARGYWDLHIREDERHGHWMLHEVALALADQYPEDAWELIFGYDQEKSLGDRAGTAIIQLVKQAEYIH